MNTHVQKTILLSRSDVTNGPEKELTLMDALALNKPDAKV
jgi:hypothetical protein